MSPNASKRADSFFVLCLFAIILSACQRHVPWFNRYYKNVTCQPQELPIVIIVPSYNNHRWYQYNLDSIYRQKYTHFRTIYIDDASPDNTGKLVQDYVQKNHLSHFTLMRNRTRHGALYNLWHAIQQCKPHELIVNLDGDDWFANELVLAHINKQYQTNDIWLTYGQFINWPTQEPGWCTAIPANVMRKRTFRAYGFRFAQPRTYYAWLAQRINEHDLIDPTTRDFYRVAGDVALMFPMVEMAAPRIQFIPDYLYIRNVKTPINDFKCHEDEQLRITKAIRKQQPYTRIYKKPLHA